MILEIKTSIKVKNKCVMNLIYVYKYFFYKLQITKFVFKKNFFDNWFLTGGILIICIMDYRNSFMRRIAVVPVRDCIIT